MDAELQNAVISAAKFLKVMLEAELKADEGIAAGLLSVVSFIVDLLQQVLGHGGHDGSREKIGREHGEDDGLGQRNEEIFGDAAQEEHGHEDDADGDGGDQGGNGDLRGAVEDGLLDGLAFFEIAVDVLDFNGRVVDQDADGQRQAAQGHDVDGFAERAQNQQRRKNRERYGDGDDERAAPAAEEDQDHDGGEAGGDDALAHDAADRGADEERLIGERRHFEGRRQLRFEGFELGANARDDVERRGVAGLDDGEQARRAGHRRARYWSAAESRRGHGRRHGHRPLRH